MDGPVALGCDPKVRSKGVIILRHYYLGVNLMLPPGAPR